MEHIRDSLRFKARLEYLSSLPDLVNLVLNYNVTIVKVDFDKLLCSKEFGWRPIAIDLRFPNGLIVEFYAAPWEMDQRWVKSDNHKIFEKVSQC